MKHRAAARISASPERPACRSAIVDIAWIERTPLTSSSRCAACVLFGSATREAAVSPHCPLYPLACLAKEAFRRRASLADSMTNAAAELRAELPSCRQRQPARMERWCLHDLESQAAGTAALAHRAHLLHAGTDAA
jgi:hypothetical protein